MSFPWEIDAQPNKPRGRKGRQRIRSSKRIEAARQAKRRIKEHPEPPSEELTNRQIAKLVREQEALLARRIQLATTPGDKSSREEKLARKIAIVGNDPNLKKDFRNKPKKIKKKQQHRDRQSGRPLQKEILRPFPQGRRLFLDRIPTDKSPMTAKEYTKYLKSAHWQEFGREYRTADDTLHQCWVCGSADYDLHHWTYIRIGNENQSDVIPLCREHHKTVHKAVKAGVPLARAHSWVKSRIKNNQPLL